MTYTCPTLDYADCPLRHGDCRNLCALASAEPKAHHCPELAAPCPWAVDCTPTGACQIQTFEESK